MFASDHQTRFVWEGSLEYFYTVVLLLKDLSTSSTTGGYAVKQSDFDF